MASEALPPVAPIVRPVDELPPLVTTRQRIMRRFLRHRMALGATIVLVLLYLMMAFADFVAPYGESSEDRTRSFLPPTVIHADGSGLYIRSSTVAISSEAEISLGSPARPSRCRNCSTGSTPCAANQLTRWDHSSDIIDTLQGSGTVLQAGVSGATRSELQNRAV